MLVSLAGNRVILKPEGSQIVFTGALSTTIFLGSIQFQYEVEKFQRLEFSNERRRQAKEADGSQAIYVTLLGGRQVQLSTTCGTSTPRSVLPDDANIDDINQRLDIRRYSIKTLECPLASATALAPIAQDHKVRFERFAAHFAELQQDISIDRLDEMQDETFSYLQDSGLTMAGNCLAAIGGTQNHCLIRSYIPEPVFEIPTNSGGTTSLVFQDFSLIIDVVSAIVPQSHTTWT